jgi:hypothetical protein
MASHARVPVSLNGHGASLATEIDRRCATWSFPRHVPKTDDLLNASALDIG